MTNLINNKTKYIFIAILAAIIVIFLLILANDVHAQTSTDIDVINIEVINIDGKTAKVKWQTNVDTTGRVIYGIKKDSLVYFIGDSTTGRVHEAIINGLKSETEYYYQIVATNNSTQTSSYVFKFKNSKYTDKTSPEISNLEVPYVSGTTAFIRWDTNEQSSSIVEFDENKTYKKRATGNNKVTDHQVILKGLKLNTTYFVRAYSIDPDNNRSAYIVGQFTTLESGVTDKADLVVNYLRPSGNNDSYIGSDNFIVSFRTNRYAYGSVKVSAKNFKTAAYNLDWNSNQEVKITGLSPAKEYRVDLSVTDILNKKYTTTFYVTTKNTAAITTGSTSVIGSNIQLANYTGNTILTTGSLQCNGEIFKQSGYYGQYFLTGIDGSVSNSRTINDFDWHDPAKFKLARIDQSLNFGKNFYALGSDSNNQPIRFFAYWRALVDVPADGSYVYNLGSDDESWVYIDGVLDGKLGSNQGSLGNKTITLKKGAHALEVYFVYRGRTGSKMSFTLDEKVKIYPWPNGCNISDLYKLKGNTTVVTNQTINIGNGGIVRVAGAEYSYYSQASILVKSNDSPDIYAIINGQKHYISSPAAFNDYGYNWNNVKTISRAELDHYPWARLIRTPDNNTVYFLYQRPEKKWLKITLNSPTVFVSYPGNFWGNVILVNKYDLDSYPDVKLIKIAGDASTYYLENNIKHLVSEQVFLNKGFNPAEVVTVNQIHLDSYKTGEALQ
jgi:hypothetical protein